MAEQRPSRRPSGGARSGGAQSGRAGGADRVRDGRRRPPRRAEPALPDGVAASDLEPSVRRELLSLPKELADRVAMHLVAAGRLLDEEPAAAYQHAAYARDIAGRIAATREAAGLAAYVVGDYPQALADLRALRRMTGSPQHLPIMADCERGLGRPERALELVRDPQAARLDPAARIELRIVESGARRDLGEAAAAVVALQVPELEQERLAPWTVRLWYAYAEALLAAGRHDEALAWFRSVVALDEEEETDAAERLALLEPDEA